MIERAVMNKEENNSSFWISYADLMAGLLFVFILLIGAIIVKYSLLQSESKLLEVNLKEEQIALEKSKEELEKNKEELNKKQARIEKTKEKLEEIDKQNKALKDEIVVLQNIIASKDKNINSKKEEISKSKTAIEDIEKQLTKINKISENKTQTIKELFAKIDMKDEELNNTKQKLTKLSNQLKNSIQAKEVATKQLKQTREEIKNLTGIKIKVISLLKQKLGEKFEIDTQSGAIRLSSNILFDQSKYELKPDSKEDLKVAVYDYLNTILENKEINRHIDKIIVEGHTNSKGSFLYNMELSQKRAYSVMAFLLKLDFDKKKLLRDLIVASGRSYLDPIYNKNGVENQDKSRRIEIKFRLKNEEAIKEIESILR